MILQGTDNKNDMNNLQSQSLLELVNDIYEAAWQPGHWNQVMAQLCQLLNARSAAMLLEDRTNNYRDYIGIHNLPGFPRVTYRLGLANRDVVFKIQQSRPIGQAAQVASHESMRHSNPWYYRIFMKPNDMGYIAAINFFNDDQWHTGIGLHRSFSAQPFGKKEFYLLELLTPHFQRALRIQRVLLHCQSRAAILQAALAKLTLGIIVLDADNRVLYSNPAADSLVASHPSLRIVNGQLRVHYPAEAAELFALLNERRAGNRQEQATGLHHPDRDHPLTVLVAHVDEAPHLPETVRQEGQVMLCLSDPEAPFAAPEEHLMATFGLTRSEAGVATALTNGLELADISKQRKVSQETVRSQLKDIFSKLGVNRQQDVVRLVLGSGLGRL